MSEFEPITRTLFLSVEEHAQLLELQTRPEQLKEYHDRLQSLYGLGKIDIVMIKTVLQE